MSNITGLGTSVANAINARRAEGSSAVLRVLLNEARDEIDELKSQLAAARESRDAWLREALHSRARIAGYQALRDAAKEELAKHGSPLLEPTGEFYDDGDPINGLGRIFNEAFGREIAEQKAREAGA